MHNVAGWTFERRLEEVLRRALPLLGPEARRQIQAILSPQTLAIVSGVLIAWVVSHAVGIGEIVDIIFLVVGIGSIGIAIFEGLDHLYDFAAGTYLAKSESDLDKAAKDFVKAVNILGIQAVLAVLFRGVPKTGKGGPIRTGGPVTAAGQAYKPTLKWTKFVRGQGHLPAGSGWTTAWGDIVVSSRGSSRTRESVLFHEKIHQILTPKLYPFRNFRIRNRSSSYERSSLSRYLEEALAESVAQVRVFGMREFFTGIRFPVKEGYVTLLRTGSEAGVITEMAALLAGGISIAGIHIDIMFEERTSPLTGMCTVPEQFEE